MKIKKICSIVGLIMVVMLFAGCQSTNKKSEGAEGSTTQVSTDKYEDVVITTKYGDLHYPDQWEDLIKTKVKDEDKSTIVTFETVIGDKTYVLFDVIIGKFDGNSVGKIVDDKGVETEVYIQTYDIQEDSDLTDGEQRRLYAMQEDLNYVIDNLMK